MNFDLLVPLLVTTSAALCGWIVGHVLNSKRDRKNKHRELRAEFLISAYTKIESAAGRKLKTESKETAGLEEAVAQIQLFGTAEQVDTLLNNLKQGGDLNPIINLLRDELRKELELPPIKREVVWVRY